MQQVGKLPFAVSSTSIRQSLSTSIRALALSQSAFETIEPFWAPRLIHVSLSLSDVSGLALIYTEIAQLGVHNR